MLVKLTTVTQLCLAPADSPNTRNTPKQNRTRKPTN